MPPAPSAPHLVLAGCGHAHLFVLEALAAGRFPSVRVTLVSPDEEYVYSGMVSGVVAGQYRPEQARFLPPRLARAAGAAFVRARVVRVDAAARRVRLDSGRELAYDILSLDVGARLAGDDLPGVAEHALRAKPVRHLLDLATTTRERSRIAIVGGGAAGVEISLCLAAALHQDRPPNTPRLTLVESGNGILREYTARARGIARELLGERGVEVRSHFRVTSAANGALHAEGGEALPFDLLVWATGPRAPTLFRDSGLPCDDAGYLCVGPTLEADGVPDLFAAGDCATLLGKPWVDRAGVYAVRQGPVLAGNLERRLRGEPTEAYDPQRHWLSLLNTGDGRAVVSYRGIGARGRVLWWLKDRIDRRFMARFQGLERE